MELVGTAEERSNSVAHLKAPIKHKSMTHRCRECKGKPRFSSRTGTLLQSSKLPYRTWVVAIYLFTTGIKGTSSMKLHRDLEVTYKTAWHLSHRIRKAYEADTPEFAGPVEVDESYFGGIEGNKQPARRRIRAAAVSARLRS